MGVEPTTKRLKVSCAAIAPQDRSAQNIIVQTQTTANTVKMAAPEIISSGIGKISLSLFFEIFTIYRQR